MSVEDTAGVEFRNIWNWDLALGLVEIDDFLGCALECCEVYESVGKNAEKDMVLTEDNRVGWEDGELGMEFLSVR